MKRANCEALIQLPSKLDLQPLIQFFPVVPAFSDLNFLTPIFLPTDRRPSPSVFNPTGLPGWFVRLLATSWHPPTLQELVCP